MKVERFQELEGQNYPVLKFEVEIRTLMKVEECKLDFTQKKKHDWNVEAIAQFYATLYFEEGDVRRIIGWQKSNVTFSSFFFDYQGYFIDYFQFASLMGFDGDDVLKDR